MDTVTVICHAFHLLLSCRFLTWTNLNFQKDLIYHLAEARDKTTKQFDYNGIV